MADVHQFGFIKVDAVLKRTDVVKTLGLYYYGEIVATGRIGRRYCRQHHRRQGSISDHHLIGSSRRAGTASTRQGQGDRCRVVKWRRVISCQRSVAR